MEVNNLVYQKKYKKYKTKYLELKKQFGGSFECKFMLKNVSNAKLVMDTNRKCTLEDWKKFDLKVLKDAGATLFQFLKIGYTIEELKAAGYSAKDFITQFNKSGNRISIKDLKNEGFTINDFKKDKFKIIDLMKEGYTIQDFIDNKFKDAGYTIRDFIEATNNLEDINKLGFSNEDIKKLGVSYLNKNNFSAEKMKVLGFTGDELSLYYSSTTLKNAGYMCYKEYMHSRDYKCR